MMNLIEHVPCPEHGMNYLVIGGECGLCGLNPYVERE